MAFNACTEPCWKVLPKKKKKKKEKKSKSYIIHWLKRYMWKIMIWKYNLSWS